MPNKIDRSSQRCPKSLPTIGYENVPSEKTNPRFTLARKNPSISKTNFELLTQQGKNIGYTSVYHNLEALSENGIIECLDRHDGRLYGNYGGEYSHVNVIDTNQIVNVKVELPPELIETIEAKTGVKVAYYQIDFYGYSNEQVFQASLEN